MTITFMSILFVLLISFSCYLTVKENRIQDQTPTNVSVYLEKDNTAAKKEAKKMLKEMGYSNEEINQMLGFACGYTAKDILENVFK